jgi:hypothetical protein
MKPVLVLLSSFTLGIMLFWYMKPVSFPEQIRKEAKIDQYAPFVVAYGNPRSRSVQKFLQKITAFITENGLNLPVIFLPSHEASHSFSGVQVLKTIPRHSVPENTFQLYRGNSEEFSGSLLAHPDVLRRVLTEHFLPDKRQFLQDMAPLGSHIQETVFAPIWNEENRAELLVFYENICIVCESGTMLLELERAQRDHPQLHIQLMAVTDYQREQITRFQKDHQVTIPIQPVSDEFRQIWHSLKEEGGSEFLQGLILLLNTDGEIVYVGKDVHASLITYQPS